MSNNYYMSDDEQNNVFDLRKYLNFYLLFYLLTIIHKILTTLTYNNNEWN